MLLACSFYIKNDSKFFESTKFWSFHSLIRILSALLTIWIVSLGLSFAFLWHLWHSVGFYLLSNLLATLILVIWLWISKKRHHSQPIHTRIERSNQENESIDLEAQTNKKNKKLSDAERIRKLEVKFIFLPTLL